MGAEAFTILAILEARDKATAVMTRVSGAMDQFAVSADRAAATAETAGASIDTSLLQTTSGANASVLASARLEGARTTLATATKAQADAERVLIEAQAQAVAAADGDAAAGARLTAALDGLTAAQKRAAKAAAAVSSAEEHQAAVGQAVIARADEEAAAVDRVAAAQARLGSTAAASAAPMAGAAKAMKVGAVAAAAIAVVSLKAAGDFESSTQHLVTDAGEAQKNLKMVQKGILDIASATGTSAVELSAAMYHIESAGFHGAQGLQLLKTAAEGAKVGGADFETVAKTLTGTMNSYGMSGDQAVAMMNQLITTTASGDMRMQDLASSLGNVAPLAAAAGLSFAQVGGAMATMTAQNMSAQQAAQDLANTIRALSNPNNVAIKEMQNLGLNSNDLSRNLGRRGLTGTLEILTHAVAEHTKGGQVLISTFNNSKQAAANADTMIKAMPPNLQALAKAYLNGSTTLGAWRKELKGLPPVQAAMMSQFGTLANKTHAFNDQLKSGSPAAQTYNAAMAKLLGGATGLNTSLMITGGRMEEFKSSTEKIAEAAKHGGSTVEDWDKIQATFNQKIDRLKYSVEAAGISIGMVLIPAASKLVDTITSALAPVTEFIGKHQKIVGLVASVAGGAAAAAIAIKAVAVATKAWSIAQGLVNTVMAIFDAEMAVTGIPELIIAIAALAAGLAYAWTHFSTFREVVITALNAVKTAGVAVWHALEAAWDGIVTAAVVTWHALETAWNAVAGAAEAVWSALVTAWDAIVTAANATWHALVSAWQAVVGAAKAVWSAITATWHAIANTTTTVWNAISGFFKKWWPLLLVIFLPFVAIVMSIWNHFHEEITSTAMSAWNAITGFFKAVWGSIQTVASVLWLGIKLAIIGPVVATWKALVAAWDAIASFLKVVWGGVKTAASVAWSGIKIAIVDPVVATWHELEQLWGAASRWLKSAWNSIKSVAGSVWGGIQAAITTPITNAWHTVSGIAGKIKSEVTKQISSAVTQAKQIASKFLDVGKAVVDGIIHGLENGGSAVIDAAKNLASSALDAAKSFLGISSPSKKFKELGGWVVHGLVDGLTGNTASVKAATTRLAKDLYVDFGNSHQALQRYIGQEDALLNTLARRRDTAAAKLKAAQKQLSTLQAEWTKERDSVASSIMQNATVITQPTDQNTPLVGGDVLANFQKQADAARLFARQLDMLRKKGLSTAIIQQIAAAGVDQGEATAAALVGSGSSVIKQMNATQASMQKAANATGSAVADSMYKTGIDSAKGLIRGLQSQEAAIDKQMLKIALAMQKAIKRALGIRSPSSVFADQVGKWIPHGIAQGVEQHAKVAVDAVAGMSRSLVGAASGRNIGGGLAVSTPAGYLGAGRSGNVIFDLRGSQVMTDKDMDVFVNKLGKQVATKLLPMGGVKIKM